MNRRGSLLVAIAMLDRKENSEMGIKANRISLYMNSLKFRMRALPTELTLAALENASLTRCRRKPARQPRGAKL
jgi:hypothetical protein